MARHLRNLQTFAPWVRPLKFGLYNMATRHLGWRIDPDFRILQHLPKVGLAIDVGGNWGQSIETIRRLRPEARIVSFEPNPVLAERLQAAYAGNAQVTIRSCALSAQAGQMRLHVPSYRDFVYDGLASLEHRYRAHRHTRPDLKAHPPLHDHVQRLGRLARLEHHGARRQRHHAGVVEERLVVGAEEPVEQRQRPKQAMHAPTAGFAWGTTHRRP
jgi:hypothetical protein